MTRIGHPPRQPGLLPAPLGAVASLRRAASGAAQGFGREGRRLAAGLRERVLHGLGRPSLDPFADLAPDPARRAANLARPEARRTYAIIFTPRSGSSRLEEILGSTGTLSRPGEFFNPEFIGGMARAFDARDMADYVAMLRRFRNTGGVFGFEATWPHIRRCFGTADRFEALLRPDAWVWLVREDIVLQAVSVSRMVQTRVAHDTSGAEPARLAEAEARFRYVAGDIAARVRALRAIERGSEAMFARLGATPLRLSYERLIGPEPVAIAARIARHVGAPMPPRARFDLRHRKLGTDKNLDFARRFRAEHAGFMRGIDRERAPLLAVLDELGDDLGGG